MSDYNHEVYQHHAGRQMWESIELCSQYSQNNSEYCL